MRVQDRATLDVAQALSNVENRLIRLVTGETDKWLLSAVEAETEFGL